MYICGGTLISDRQISTAAHCVMFNGTILPPEDFVVIFGEDYPSRTDEQEFRVGVQEICASPDFTDENLRYDWALITLEQPVEFNDYVQPACLPRENQKIITTGPNAVCFLVGGGSISKKPNPAGLNKPDIVVSSKFLRKMRAENVACQYQFGPISRDRVCYTGAGGARSDSCAGDSGGPILCLDLKKRWTLMASVSYGPRFCDHHAPAAYSRTRYVIQEIAQKCYVDLLR